MPPLFYWGHWQATVVPWTSADADLAEALATFPPDRRPNAVLFFGTEDLDERMQRAEQAMGPLRVIGRAEPGLVDRVVHWLNPVNRNEAIVVARTAP
jgi:predicted enzyme related to lactoylglutathione lyase